MKLEIPVVLGGENLGWDFVTANECKCGGTPSLKKVDANDMILYYLVCQKCGNASPWSNKIENTVKYWNDGEIV